MNQRESANTRRPVVVNAFGRKPIRAVRKRKAALPVNVARPGGERSGG